MPLAEPRTLKGERAVVTGFVGSHLCEALLDLGAEVVCVDNFLTGAKAKSTAFRGVGGVAGGRLGVEGASNVRHRGVGAESMIAESGTQGSRRPRLEATETAGTAG